jgi:hypothetical protein
MNVGAALTLPMSSRHAQLIKHTDNITFIFVVNVGPLGQPKQRLGYELDYRGFMFRFPAAIKAFLCLHSIQTGSAAPQPHIQWQPRAIPSEVKRPES